MCALRLVWACRERHSSLASLARCASLPRPSCFACARSSWLLVAPRVLVACVGLLWACCVCASRPLPLSPCRAFFCAAWRTAACRLYMLCSSRAPRASLALALRGCCSSLFCLRFVRSSRLRSAFGRQWGRFCSLFPAVGVPSSVPCPDAFRFAAAFGLRLFVGSPPARARGSVRSGASCMALRPSAHSLAFLRPLFTSQLRSAVIRCLALRSVLMPPSASLRPPCSLRSPPPPNARGLSSVKNFF